MNKIGNVDYHIHYFIDKCAKDEMTINQIEKTAFELGLKEICILKHYCEALPNHESEFITWYQINQIEFDYFVNDFKTHHSQCNINMLSGVETELLDDQGHINIPQDKIDQIDMIALSCHWLPNLEGLPLDLMYYPDVDFYQDANQRSIVSNELNQWIEKVNQINVIDIISSYIQGYVRAIEQQTKIKTLSHMYDGLFPLDLYHIPVHLIAPKTLLGLMNPLFEICAKRNVLWELINVPVKRPYILHHAAKQGVKFCASSDAHMIQNGWGNLIDHYKTEEYISSLGLPKGVVLL